MKIDKFDIKGPILVKNKIFHDHRGFFYEKANLKKKEKVLMAYLILYKKIFQYQRNMF